MAQKNKQANHSAARLSATKHLLQKELPAISWTGYASRGKETQRRIEKVQQSLIEAREELAFKQ